ncbi:colanic acid biosynthesis glycosyltransferase WcaL, partial [Candidatus Aerophobetes bacterium]|nr:colanic acid biosynthesis glycosyltransferase WcaL [Candidatus Aerophobetes bacterium]
GFLVPEKDIEGLVDRLGYLIAHPELWEKLGSRGREVVEEKFNLFKQISRLEEIYAKLLS